MRLSRQETADNEAESGPGKWPDRGAGLCALVDNARAVGYTRGERVSVQGECQVSKARPVSLRLASKL